MSGNNPSSEDNNVETIVHDANLEETDVIYEEFGEDLEEEEEEEESHSLRLRSRRITAK